MVTDKPLFTLVTPIIELKTLIDDGPCDTLVSIKQLRLFHSGSIIGDVTM